jgi:signal transduction histidine kinase
LAGISTDLEEPRDRRARVLRRPSRACRLPVLLRRERWDAAADEARRRLEWDLHDGAQQRLISLALDLRMVQDTVSQDLPELRAGLGHAVDALS